MAQKNSLVAKKHVDLAECGERVDKREMGVLRKYVADPAGNKVAAMVAGGYAYRYATNHAPSWFANPRRQKLIGIERARRLQRIGGSRLQKADRAFLHQVAVASASIADVLELADDPDFPGGRRVRLKQEALDDPLIAQCIEAVAQDRHGTIRVKMKDSLLAAAAVIRGVSGAPDPGITVNFNLQQQAFVAELGDSDVNSIMRGIHEQMAQFDVAEIATARGEPQDIEAIEAAQDAVEVAEIEPAGGPAGSEEPNPDPEDWEG